MSTLSHLAVSYGLQACNIVNKTCSRKTHTADEVIKLLELTINKLRPRGKAFKRLVDLHSSRHKL